MKDYRLVLFSGPLLCMEQLVELVKEYKAVDDAEEMYTSCVVRQVGRQCLYYPPCPSCSLRVTGEKRRVYANEADDNLVIAWPRMRRAIIEATLACVGSIPERGAIPESIRGWLCSPENQAVIQKATCLDLANSQLKSLPEEIGLFIGLLELDLRCNKLIEVDIPRTLIKLQEISLNHNQLRKVTLPSKVSGRQRFVRIEENKKAEVDWHFH